MGVPVPSDLSKSSGSSQGGGSGIGGFVGKLLSRNRGRSEVDDQKGSLKQRTKSPRPRPFGKKGKGFGPSGSAKAEEANGGASNKKISVATMPKKQQQKIAKRLGGLHSKRELLRELDSSQKKLQKKLKLHANKVMALKAEMARIEEMKQSELKQWTAWYVMELRDLGTELYSTENALLRHQIEVCCFALIFLGEMLRIWQFQ